MIPQPSNHVLAEISASAPYHLIGTADTEETLLALISDSSGDLLIIRQAEWPRTWQARQATHHGLIRLHHPPPEPPPLPGEPDPLAAAVLEWLKEVIGKLNDA